MMAPSTEVSCCKKVVNRTSDIIRVSYYWEEMRSYNQKLLVGDEARELISEEELS